MISFFLILKDTYRKTRYDVYVLKNNTDIETSKQSLFKVKRSKIRKYIYWTFENLNRVVSVLRNYFIILHYHILIIIFHRRSFSTISLKNENRFLNISVEYK